MKNLYCLLHGVGLGMMAVSFIALIIYAFGGFLLGPFTIINVVLLVGGYGLFKFCKKKILEIELIEKNDYNPSDDDSLGI